MDEHREHASRNILAHFDKKLFDGCVMYGVPMSAMTREELKAVICFMAKHPDVVQALAPICERRKS